MRVQIKVYPVFSVHSRIAFYPYQKLIIKMQNCYFTYISYCDILQLVKKLTQGFKVFMKEV